MSQYKAIRPCPFCGRVDDLSIKIEKSSTYRPVLYRRFIVGAVEDTETTISCKCGCSFVTWDLNPIAAWNRRNDGDTV